MRLFPTFLIACLTCACSKPPEVAKQDYLRSGSDYARQGKFGEAIVQYANAVQIDPQSGEAHLGLAAAYTASGDNRAAFPEWIRAADLLTNDVAVQVRAARLLVNGGFFEEAKARARAVLQRDPDNVDALLALGNALAGLKGLDDAARVLERAVSIDPERAGTYTSLGVVQLAKKDLDSAERTFQRAVQVSPKSSDVFVNLGNFYRVAGRLPDAERALLRAVEIAPADNRANETLASLYISWKRPADAEKFLKGLVAQTGEARARYTLADFYASVGRSADAVTTLEEVARDESQYAAAKTRIAVVEYSIGRRSEAHALVDEVLRRQPAHVGARTVKARLLLADGRRQEALDEAKAAVTANPKDPDAQLVLGRAELAHHDDDAARKAFNEVLRLNPDSLAAKLELSALHYAREEYASAQEFAEQALKTNPDNIPSRMALIRALMMRDDQARAEREIQGLISLYPNSAEAHSELGALWLKRGDSMRARRAFERAAELKPTSFEAASGLAALDIAQQNGPAARTRIDKLLGQQPDAAAALVLAAKTYALTGEVDKVEGTLMRALQADPSNPETYGLLGQHFVNQGRMADAKRQFGQLVQIQPKSVAAVTMMGLLCYAEGDHACAQSWWEKAIQIDSHAAAAANNLAWLYAEGRGSLDVALELAKSAKASFPELPEVNDTLGWIYHKKNLPTQALTYLQLSAAMQPKNPLYQYHIGMTYAAQGEDSKARTHLERALALSSTFTGAAEAKKTLASLVY